jgi:glycosyltransferase involved in cell wall biosynthesis
MKLSVIIPAYNEEKLISGCLEKVYAALRAHASADWTAEVIVVDNNSNDRTAALAREAGARVVFEPINQISRARNAGAQVADGDWFLFVDADSYLDSATLEDVLHCIRRGGYVGGGCLIGLDQLPRGAAFGIEFCNLVMRTMKWAAGSLVFCRKDAFQAVGGFSTDLYAAEEIQFSIALKRWARNHGLRFTILKKHRHISSGRKFYLYSRGEILKLLLRSFILSWRTLRDPKKLDIFYDGRR